MGTSLPEKTSTIGKASKEKSLTVPSLFNGISLLAPLKAPKSYGTYSKQQQEEVIAFIKEGNSLRTAEKFFGIPKSTMHCWLKKIHNSQNGESNNNQSNNSNSSNSKSNSTNDALNTYTMANGKFFYERTCFYLGVFIRNFPELYAGTFFSVLDFFVCHPNCFLFFEEV